MATVGIENDVASVDAVTLQWGTLENMTFQIIREALRRSGGNRVKAAASLGVARRTIYNYLSKFGEEVKS